ncbi:putative transcription factor interactor and regulator CCHC(Zn) family [Helianthus annuus]|nr:putative transcription factor interactor and regulator CCHC(Zn) family [Helianthus annuus]
MMRMPPRRSVNNRRNENNDIPIETLIANAVNTAIAGLVPNLLQQLQQNNNNGPQGGNNNNGPPGGNNNNGPQGGNVNPPIAIHDWLDRFQKLKPKSFSTAANPVEAENSIAHMEKNFEVLGVNDEFKVRLASYKLEDDAHRWWKTLKNARGGDNYAATLAWDEFRALFYQQYFTDADRSEYLREYATIMQGNDEPIMEFKNRFCRLVNFLGAAAGTPEQQTNTFKWAICDRDRKFILNLRFNDITEIVDAVKNLDNDKKHRQKTFDENRKRPRENIQGQSSAHVGNDRSLVPPDRRHRSDKFHNSQSRNGGNQNQNHRPAQNQAPVRAQPLNQQNRDIIPPCVTCGKSHRGVCRRAAGLCFRCGETGHMIRNCPKRDPKADTGGNAKPPAGRVFALTANDAANAPGNQGNVGN